MSAAAPRRRLSPLRVFVLVAVLAGLAFVTWTQASRAYDRLTAKPSDTWFAPYVDVTLTPTLAFEDESASPSPYAVLGFVVADRRDPCTPTWGTYYDLDGAGRELDLDRRIARVRQRGGDVVVSFGGAANSDLAVACAKKPALAAAYRSVVRRYEAGTIDLDIEGAALDDRAANARRVAAIRAIQREAPKGRPLEVWLTLPVTPDGLRPNALAVVDGMLRGGVDLAGVNLMTMDFGGSKPARMSMGEATTRALTATHRQLAAAYRRSGRRLSSEQVWARLGATPMIGVNDVPGETFTLGDARSLVAFANRRGLGRVSMWSANRDAPCGAQDDTRQVSNTCRGVDQKPLAFTWELGRLDAEMPVRTPAPARGADAAEPARDDPDASPYPIWQTARAYRGGEKVVWHGTVYQAKWWTEGDMPDAPVAHAWDTPWRDVGPVLPSDAPSAPPAGAVPGWSQDGVYERADRVRHGGYLYEARWWTQGDEPEPDPERPDDQPWTLLGKAVGDLAPVFERYPAWSGSAEYDGGDRVMRAGLVYEAKRPVAGVVPDPTPERPGRAPWRLVGRYVAQGGQAPAAAQAQG